MKSRDFALRIFHLTALTFLLAIALNSIIAILHELGHYLVAVSFTSAGMVLIMQTDAFPPIIWFTGRVTYVGALVSALEAFYLAPAFATFLPAIAAILLARGTPTIEKVAVRNALLLVWALEVVYSLFPSFNSSTGPNDGAQLLGRAGVEFASTNPLAQFLASQLGWITFRLGWWMCAVYAASIMVFARPRLGFILAFSTASFLVAWAIMNLFAF